jgi:predicted RNA-binding Zn-ribbon protein involved in translation (DUF1610 family)
MTTRRNSMEEKIRTSELEQQQKKELTFECPKCGGNTILEHLVNYENIYIFEDGEIEPGDEWWESDKVEYSCGDCFWTIVNEDDCIIRDEPSLIRWLKNEPKAPMPATSEMGDGHGEVKWECDPQDDVPDLEPGQLRFVCPKCGGKQLDDVNHTATYLFIHQDGSVEYGKAYGGDYEHFRCHACRWIVEDEEYGCFDDPEILVSWLQANCDQSR